MAMQKNGSVTLQVYSYCILEMSQDRGTERECVFPIADSCNRICCRSARPRARNGGKIGLFVEWIDGERWEVDQVGVGSRLKAK